MQYREDFKEVYNNLGAVYIDRGRIGDAIASYKRAIEISPNFAEAYNNLGVAYTKTRLTMMRYRHSKGAVHKQKPCRRTFQPRSNIHGERNGTKEAIVEYSEVLRIIPGDTQALYYRGVLYVKNNRLNDALVDMKKVVEVDPNLAISHQKLGAIYQELGRIDEAIVEYKRHWNYRRIFRMRSRTLRRLTG